MRFEHKTLIAGSLDMVLSPFRMGPLKGFFINVILKKVGGHVLPVMAISRNFCKVDQRSGGKLEFAMSGIQEGLVVQGVGKSGGKNLVLKGISDSKQPFVHKIDWAAHQQPGGTHRKEAQPVCTCYQFHCIRQQHLA